MSRVVELILPFALFSPIYYGILTHKPKSFYVTWVWTVLVTISWTLGVLTK